MVVVVSMRRRYVRPPALTSPVLAILAAARMAGSGYQAATAAARARCDCSARAPERSTRLAASVQARKSRKEARSAAAGAHRRLDAKCGPLSLVRVPRLVMETVTDDDLIQLYRRSILLAARTATTIVAQEAVRRPSVAVSIQPAEAYRRLIAAEDDDERALALVQEARQHAESAGESTAQWDLAELELHIDNGNGEAAQAMLAEIEKKHLDDPQVAAAVYRLLYETGVISPEEVMGQPHPHHHHGEAHAPALSGAVPAAAPQESGSRIWTPDSERPASGKKSSLWTPS